MSLNPETPSAKKLKCDDKGVNTDTPAFEFNNDLPHPPDPSHKFRWNPLLVDKSMVEETIIGELEKKKVREKLDKLFPVLLEKHFLTMHDEWINRVVDKIIKSSGVKLFEFFMDKQIQLYQGIGKEIGVEFVDEKGEKIEVDCDSEEEDEKGEMLEVEEGEIEEEEVEEE